MSGCEARVSECKLPRFWRRRWRHRVYVCDCGAMWRVVRMGYGAWTWERVA